MIPGVSRPLRAIRAAACAAALPLSSLAAGGCASSPFTLRYCEDGAARVTSCGCTPAAREVVGGRIGRVNVHEYAQTARGLREREYQDGQDLQFVLRGRWFVIDVYAFAASPSLQTWIRCGDVVFPGEVVHRSTIRESGGGHEHQFLALFAGSPDDVATPICRMHVVLGPTRGWGLTHMVQRVYFVNRTTDPPLPIEGLTWSVAIEDQPSPAPTERRARLEPVLPAPEPRLCRVGRGAP